MEYLESTRLSVELLEIGKEKSTKQEFSNIKENPNSAQIVKLGETLATIAPGDTTLDSIVKTEKTRIIKDQQAA